MQFEHREDLLGTELVGHDERTGIALKRDGDGWEETWGCMAFEVM